VDRLARAAELPEASIVGNVLKITPPDDQEPEELEQLTRQAYAMLPRIKITDLLIEVEEWTSFTAHFTHLRNGEVVSDRALLLSAILADGIEPWNYPHGGSLSGHIGLSAQPDRHMAYSGGNLHQSARGDCEPSPPNRSCWTLG
jgi:hypothetical protein